MAAVQVLSHGAARCGHAAVVAGGSQAILASRSRSILVGQSRHSGQRWGSAVPAYAEAMALKALVHIAQGRSRHTGQVRDSMSTDSAVNPETMQAGLLPLPSSRRPAFGKSQGEKHGQPAIRNTQHESVARAPKNRQRILSVHRTTRHS